MKNKRNINIVAGLIVLFFTFSWLISSCNNSETLKEEVFFSDKDKLWAHAVYDPEEANHLLESFSGLETDIVFDADRNVFDVRHDIEDTFTGRTLDNFLDSIKLKNERHFWLDFKNLNKNNLNASSQRLKTVLDKHKLRERAIIESFHPDRLSELAKDGFYTSYWVPHFEMNEATQERKDDAVNKVKKMLQESEFNALSCHHEMYPLYKKHFPESTFHLWTNGLTTEEDKQIIKDLHAEEQVRVILVDYKENFIKRE